VIAFRKLFPCLAIGAFLIGTANEARCDLVGYQIISSGQGESAFLGIEYRDNGVCYGNSGFGIWEHQICAAGIPQESLIHYTAPPQLFAYPPTCCTVQEPVVVQPTATPEPASLGLVLIAFGLMFLPRRWKVTRR
jgi:hypothetical protein